MSIALAIEKNGELIVAADTLTSFGHTKVPPVLHAADKVRRVGASYLATTGWGLYENILDDVIARRKNIRLGSREQIFAFFLRLWNDLHKKYSFVNDQIEEKESGPFGNLDSTFLVAGRAGIFYVGPDMSVTKVKHYFAIGSGAPFALGTLHALQDSKLGAEAIARRAVEAAIAFDTYCGGEAQIHRVAGGARRSRRG
ncbi:MAG: Ntn hydrolase family protein [Candidatus Methylomirabilia bacterium]